MNLKYAFIVSLTAFCALLLALTDLFTTFGLENDFNSFEIVFLRGFLVVFLTLATDIALTLNKNNNNNDNSNTVSYLDQLQYCHIYILLNGLSNPDTKKWLFARGIVRGIGICIFYYILNFVDLGTANALCWTSTIWVLLFEKCVLNTPIYVLHVICVLLAMIGVVILCDPSQLFNSGDSKTIIGVLLGVGGGMLGGIAMVLMRKACVLEGENVSLAMEGTYCVSFSLIICGMSGSFISYDEFLNHVFISNSVSLDGYLSVIGVGLCSYLMFNCMNYAFSQISAAQVSAIMLTSTVWAYIFQILFLNEDITWYTGFGAVLITLPIALLFAYNIYKQSSNNIHNIVVSHSRSNSDSHFDLDPIDNEKLGTQSISEMTTLLSSDSTK